MARLVLAVPRRGPRLLLAAVTAVLAVPVAVLALTVAPSQAASAPAAGGVFALASGASGKCLEVPASSTASGALLTQAACSAGATRQQWKLVASGSQYTIVNANSGMCIDVPSGAATSGLQLQQWGCGSAKTNQLWSFTASATAGKYLIHNTASGMCVSDKDGSTAGNNPIVQEACSDVARIQWRFDLVTAPTSTPTSATSTTTAPFKVFVAGDSTASTYTSAEKPRAGWGQALPVFLTSNVTVVNMAQSGRSSKSFIEEGFLATIMSQIKSGDYLLISFGHNDEKTDSRHTDPYTTFKSYLSQYIDQARAKGAKPVLLTPVERRNFTSAGVISPTHGEYPAAMRQLAGEKGVPLVDLTALSTTLWNSVGVEGSKKYFLWLPAGTTNYPAGVEDNTHFQAHGAIEVARLIAKAMSSQSVLAPANFRQLGTTTIADSAITWPN